MACILNVEDDSPARFLKSRILERAGFQVVEAVTAADAIRSASGEELRLVLLDLRLPDGDGFYVCEQIKATRPTLPIVMITSTYATAQGRQDGLASGADAYLIEPVPAERLVQIVRRFLEPGAEITGDPHRLRQIVWNLLSNATKFTPHEGTVTVRVATMESRVELTVADTGQGIEPGFLPYVFDRFRQGDSSTTRGHGGLGLGLALVRHLVEAHGGTISAASDGPGQGTTLTVTLPARVKDEDGDRTPAAPMADRHAPSREI